MTDFSKRIIRSNRREFIGGSAAAVLLASGLSARAQGAKTIKIGFISPVSGPLAAFGQGDAFVLKQVREVLSKGYKIGETTYAIEILDRDTQSDPSRAAQLAKELITSAGVHLILASSTPETINPVADACEASGVPCVSTVMPWQAWYFGRGAKPGQPSPFKWSYHFGFGVDEFAKCYISQWNLIQTNKKVGVLYPNDADGNAIRTFLAPQLTKAGFQVVDPGGFEDFTVDYSAQIRAFKEAGVEIINSFALPPDFAAFWRQAAQQRLTNSIKIAQVAKTGLFPSDIEAMGSLGINLSSATYWHKDMPYKSPLTGQSAADLAKAYEATSNKQWVISLGSSLALFDVGLAALSAASDPTDKAAIVKSIASLKTDTIGGVVDFTSGPVPNVASGPILGTQWVKGAGKWPVDYVMTENATDTKVPVTAKLIAYSK
jgi:branched-chain amino acid transport system substrate-binding protein